MMEAPVVLLYNMDSERGRKIKMLCLPLKIRARSVTPDEYGLTLRELLDGVRPGERADGQEAENAGFSDEMLVMANLTGTQMNGLLQGFRRKKIPPVALKAVLTAVNAGWDSRRLRDELSLEHEAMLRGVTAHGEEKELK